MLSLLSFVFVSLVTRAQEHKLPVIIDAVKEAPYSEIGTSKVVNSCIGKYREAGNRRFDRIAYLFEAEQVEEFAKLTLVYPDDKDRMCEVYLFTEAFMDHNTILNRAGGGENSLGSSYITGHTYQNI
ncbi:MAG: hypothetical protein M1445_15415 [Bacteroidetes bacterium]|nr:hypothetical protein [Bacteroidota bacterium]MCL6101930.1 hypothetical protein [Bacteroidota bacterium]